VADRKERMALLSRYGKLHLQKYEQKANLNLNVEQWASDALVESYGIGVCYDLLDYYFTVAQSPSWNYFAYNTEKIFQAKLDKEKDDKERIERRKIAKEWLSD
jgi:hypothetical protein